MIWRADEHGMCSELGVHPINIHNENECLCPFTPHGYGIRPILAVPV